ncbi:MAG: bifunctional folylpolyglutamate synthase/dihydrofolate synthase [Anaerolineae bacterium]
MITYQQALDYIYSFVDYEKKVADRYAPARFNLARMEHLLSLLGDPHRRYPSVHIAGTKGKGSTAAMMANILGAAGYRTGLYTSPHLHTYRERIRVNNRLISEEEVTALVERLRPLVDTIEDITTFEITTALAFLYLAEQGVDFAVLEVGLGGRLDATNVVKPLVAVITSLSFDHTYLLGETLPQIAREKAGIIKPGVPVVSAPQPPEALAVIEEVCRERGAQLTVVGRDWTWQAGEASLEGQKFKVQSSKFKVQSLWIPLLGRHELINATTAVAAIHLLREQGVGVPAGAVAQGLRRVRWPGRLEILNRRPLLVVDGAHNGDSARRLAEALGEYFGYRRLILVFGASADKDIAGMLRELLPPTQALILTQARHPRAADPRWLREQVIACGANPSTEVVIAAPVAAALERALAIAGEEDLICFAGSLFVVAEAREAWAERAGQGLPERDPPAGRWPPIMQAVP